MSTHPGPFPENPLEKTKNTFHPSPDEESTPPIFTPEEEASLLAASTAEKLTANSLFGRGDYSSAIQVYLKALATCPTYLDYDIAVLRCNICACHLKLSEWKNAVAAATEALEALDRVDPPPPKPMKDGGDGDGDGNEDVTATTGQVQEISETTVLAFEALSRAGHTLSDVHKIRGKALLRRAKAQQEVGGWAALQGALDDYNRLSHMPYLAPIDQKIVQTALHTLPRQVEMAQKSEMGEMMGKLKQLGNGILKPFGLSTENFNFVKDEVSGGYSVQFNQN
ncbi:hypothetical protein K432DRAFT_387820 [Lepidopterella palustris CBS 459.81]|uniref:Tetratricopeptide repeat protein 1 n=1 Tax=Lepidopterella palustris CBS 459.81 TaxID=1314670 RepID=A0A8E2EMG4_9PEZI|nr:hypothetical protein K432DRAFT_387820 [Lepidopterella palustris CBS 459.81]